MKILKRIFIWLAIAFFFVFVASIAIAVLFEEEIGQQLVTQINKELVNDMQAEKFRLSLIRGFPKVSADLQGVVIPDNNDGVLLEAEHLSFEIGLLGLLTSNFKISSVAIENGALFVKINRQGKANYFITKPSPNSQATAQMDFDLSLDEALLKNMELIYINKEARQEVLWRLQNALFSGKFDSGQFFLQSNANIQSSFVELDKKRYFVGKDLAYKAKIYVDRDNELYEFQEGMLTVDRNDFNIRGTVQRRSGFTDFDLMINTPQGSIESVVQLLPEDFQYLAGFESSGDFQFDATIKGQLDERENPVVNITFGLEDGRLSHRSLESAIRDVSFEAEFDSGRDPSGRNASFAVKNFKGYFNRELIEAELAVINRSDPKIRFRGDGTLPLKTIYGLLDSPAITDGRGEIEIRNLELEGRYEDMINPSRIHRVTARGVLEFDDAGLTINDERLTFDRGLIQLDDNRLDIRDVKLEGAGSEIIFNGNASNFLPVLLADSVNSQEAKLLFDARLTSEQMDIDRLIKTTEIQSESSGFISKGPDIDSVKTKNIARREKITNFLEGKFVAEIEAFNYDLIDGESFTGELIFENKQMQIIGEAGAMGGSFDIDGVGYFEKTPRLNVKIVCNDIDATEFFRQNRDFAQDVLQSRHIAGTLNSRMVVEANWDKDGNFLYDDLKVNARLGIQDGELNDFEMLESFSRYVNPRELRRVRFVDMENWLEIKNGQIYIPVMFIQTNALNLLLSGTHTFDNKIDYNIKVNAGQVLLTKLKNQGSGLKPQPAKKNGLFNLYFSVTGNVETYDVETNKRKVKKEFSQSEYKKEIIQQELVKAFGRRETVQEMEVIDKKVYNFEKIETESDEEYLDVIQGGG